MDLGLTGKKAIICASSKGLGRSCALALAQEGVDVVINGRDSDSLSQTADDIAKVASVGVTSVLADLNHAEGRAAILEACPKPDILINNNGGPPPGDFRNWTREDWDKGLTANLLTPVELIKATVDGMAERGFGRIVNVTSIAVKMPFPGLAMSSAARSGLTSFIATVAREMANKNVTINNLQPGLFATNRLIGGLEGAAKAQNKPVDEVRRSMLANIPAGRFGDPDEFAHACAYLCSAHSGYITGQNVLLDGGYYPGAF